jgi:AraC family transcriptional activator of tynA and feaB
MSTADNAIRSWSSEAVPSANRMDCWMHIVGNSLWPVTDFRDMSADFSVQLEEASLGCITATHERISAHCARRTARDVERTAERSYLLFNSLKSPWGIAHNGHSQQLRQGDIVLVGEGEHEADVHSGFDGVILKCPAHWVHSWLPDPELLIGRPIFRDSKWGRVLSPIIGQFTPSFAAAAPLPHVVLTDHLGAVLAMIAGDNESRVVPELVHKILDCLQQRLSEPTLTAEDIAASLNLSLPTLHYALRANRGTFASHLHDARIKVALEMLSSRQLWHLTPQEIARSTGFATYPYFARAVRKRTGHLPADFRLARLGRLRS